MTNFLAFFKYILLLGAAMMHKVAYAASVMFLIMLNAFKVLYNKTFN